MTRYRAQPMTPTQIIIWNPDGKVEFIYQVPHGRRVTEDDERTAHWLAMCLTMREKISDLFCGTLHPQHAKDTKGTK